MTMKKEYIAPVLEVVVIETPKMMSGSPGKGGDYNGGQVLAPEMTSFDEELDMD